MLFHVSIHKNNTYWLVDYTIVRAQSATSKIYTSSCDLLGYPQVSKYYFYEWKHEIT